MSKRHVAGPSRVFQSSSRSQGNSKRVVEPVTQSSSSDGVDSDEAGKNSGQSFINSDNSFSSSVLLSCLIKRGIMDMEEIKGTIQRACNFYQWPSQRELSTAEGIQGLIRQINKDISRLNMIVKSIHCEITGKKYYTVRLMRHSDMTKFQTEFKKGEIVIINECVQAMLLSNGELSVPFTDCLTIARKHTKVHYNYSESKKFFQKLLKMSYFVKNATEPVDEGDEDDFSVTLGCRALEEFLGLLQESFPGLLKNCKICSQPMLHGYECRQCDVPVHRHCFLAFVKASQVCPGDGCGGKWSRLSDLSKRTFQIEIASQSSGTEATATSTATEEEN